AILYELLTGRPPFKAATTLETVLQVLSADPVPPSRLQSAVHRDLDTICLKCLDKDRSKRYATAEALAEELRRFVNGEPIRARPTPAWERLGKWARGKPAQAALIAALALAVLGGTTGAVFYALYKDQQAAALQLQLDLRGRIDALWVRGQEAEAAGQ